MAFCSVRQRLVSNNERCPKIRIDASETRLESPRKTIMLLFFYALIDYDYQRAAIFLIHLLFTDQYSKLQIHNRKHLTFFYTERQRRQKPINYRPQTKFAKVMFSHVSVILSTGGRCLGPRPGGEVGESGQWGGVSRPIPRRRFGGLARCLGPYPGGGWGVWPWGCLGPNPGERLGGYGRCVSRPRGLSRPTPGGGGSSLTPGGCPGPGECITAYTEVDTSQQTSRRLPLRAVCILLECILVSLNFVSVQCGFSMESSEINVAFLPM